MPVFHRQTGRRLRQSGPPSFLQPPAGGGGDRPFRGSALPPAAASLAGPAPSLRPGSLGRIAVRARQALAAIALGAAAVGAPAAAGRMDAGPRAPLAAAAGEVIVGFRADAALLRKQALAAPGPGETAVAAQARLAARALELGARHGLALSAGPSVGGTAQVMRADGIDAAALAARLAADPDVAYAVPNGRKRAYTAPNDPLYGPAVSGSRPNGPASGQWYLRAPTAETPSGIDIEPAWDRTFGRPDVVVAVLDTGVRFDHPDLGRTTNGGPLLPGYDFVANAQVANDGGGRDADPSDPGDWVSAEDLRLPAFADCEESDSSWHGTKTASLVAARTNNAIGMAGTAPGVRVLPLRVLGKCFGYDSDIIAAMRWAAGLTVTGVPANPTPARVINLSLGGEGVCNAAYQAAVDEITARGVVVVAAAGNSAGGPVSTPANCRGVVSVLALRHAGTKVGFSDLGPEITVAAPGGNCVNITAGSQCLYPILAATDVGTRTPAGPAWSDAVDPSVGTSFASPLVAGVAGLMLSVQPGLTPAQVASMLRATARPFPTTGGDNGDGTVVEACHAPASGVTQLQCYCTTGLCGAGMLDAGRAVAAAAAAAAPFARIDAAPAAAVAGTPVVLSASTADGRAVAAWSWTLVDGGGIVGGFDSSTNAPTATLTPTAAGQFTVQLSLTDAAGQTDTTRITVTVAAAPVVPPATPAPPGGSSGGGGGGSSGGWWALGVAAAAAWLRWLASRSRPA